MGAWSLDGQRLHSCEELCCTVDSLPRPSPCGDSCCCCCFLPLTRFLVFLVLPILFICFCLFLFGSCQVLTAIGGLLCIVWFYWIGFVRSLGCLRLIFGDFVMFSHARIHTERVQYSTTANCCPLHETHTHVAVTTLRCTACHLFRVRMDQHQLMCCICVHSHKGS